MTYLNATIQKGLVGIECFKCGVEFFVSKELDGNWRRDKTSFYCPNGHNQSYIEGTAEILQNKLNDREQEINRLNAEVLRLERLNKKKKQWIT